MSNHSINVYIFKHYFMIFADVPGNRKKGTKRSMINSSRSTASLYCSLDRHNFGEDGTENQDISIFSFKSIAMATTNFSNSNKVGQGGFGAVYKVLFLNLVILANAISMSISLCQQWYLVIVISGYTTRRTRDSSEKACL